MKKMVTGFFATLAAIIFTTAAIAGAAAGSGGDDALKAASGLWYTGNREGGVELYPCDGKICGRFQWVKRDGGRIGSLDTHNPDPALRRHPLCHMQLMGGFTPDGNRHYGGGWIYNPRDGGTYSAELILVDSGTLRVRGYLFTPLLGESQTWTRARSMPSCASN